MIRKRQFFKDSLHVRFFAHETKANLGVETAWAMVFEFRRLSRDRFPSLINNADDPLAPGAIYLGEELTGAETTLCPGRHSHAKRGRFKREM